MGGTLCKNSMEATDNIEVALIKAVRVSTFAPECQHSLPQVFFCGSILGTRN